MLHTWDGGLGPGQLLSGAHFLLGQCQAQGAVLWTSGAEKKVEMETREQEKQYRRQAEVKEVLNGDLQVQSFLQVSKSTTTGA